MHAKRTAEDLLLTRTLRATGRRFEAGKPVDLAGLRKSIEVLRDQRPHMFATLMDLIQAAEDEIVRGERDAALKHFRAAIELAESADQAKRIADATSRLPAMP